MKKLLFLLGLTILYISGLSQVSPPTQTVTLSDPKTEAIVKNTLTIQGSFNPPHRDTTFIATTFGQIVIRPADSLAYISTGLTGGSDRHWVLFGNTGNGSGATWGVNLNGDIAHQLDLQLEFAGKQNILPAGVATKYWDATGALRDFPTIPAQMNLTVPNGGNLVIAGVYPNLTIVNGLTNLSQLTNGPGYITQNQTITITGDMTGSGNTNISAVLPNVATPGTCTLCSLSWNAKGLLLFGSSGSGSSPVTSVYGRTGAVIARAGDIDIDSVHNGVSTAALYTNPSWIGAIAWSILTGKPTTIAGYGITDNLVNTFNTRSGAVTLTSGDVTTALTYTPVPPTRTLTINGTTLDLSANRSWTVTGTGTLSRISPIDSLGANANGIQISGGNIVPSSATATTPGMETAAHFKEVDSIINRLYHSKIILGHAGAGKWGGFSSPLGDSLYVKNWSNGTWSTSRTATDSSNIYDVDTAAARTYFNGYYLAKTAFITVNGTPYNLSTNPSITVSGGGTTDTANTTTAGLMSAYTYNKTLHPLITWNDSAVAGNDVAIYSNGDTLKGHNFRFGYGLKDNSTTAVSYVSLDSSLLTSVPHLHQALDSMSIVLTSSIAGKQNTLSGSGYPKFSGTTPSYMTPTQVTADLNVFTSTLKGLVPAGGTDPTLFLNQTGTFTAPAITTGVVTYNTRSGAVVPASGDYTAAQVTNAVSTIGTYANPSWLTAVAWSIISSKPTTIAGFGITDALVNTFNGRNGTVVPTTGDYTAAQVTNAASTIGSYSNPSWITSLAWSKLTSTPTTLSGYGITDNVYKVIQTNGSSVTGRSTLNFGPEFTAFDAAGVTGVNINSIGASKITGLFYQTITTNGVGTMPGESILNPNGEFTLTDEPGSNRTTLSINSIASSKITGLGGTYTPAFTTTTNLSGLTASVAQWTRSGNIVTVHGKVIVNFANSGANVLLTTTVTLPIASSISSIDDVVGTAVIGYNNPTFPTFAGMVFGHTTSGTQAIIQIADPTGGYFSSNTNVPLTFEFSYIVH